MAMVDTEGFLFYFIHLMLRFSDFIYELSEIEKLE